eukprot:snap_masked-scaffold_5-processed-gene-12.11-mRNA-1 protein AED:1.00 eAED:1.00 QI:0/0/0/0/1/1/2/0/65
MPRDRESLHIALVGNNTKKWTYGIFLQFRKKHNTRMMHTCVGDWFPALCHWNKAKALPSEILSVL